MRVDEVRARVARSFALFAIAFAGVGFLATPAVFAQDSDGQGDADDSDIEEVVVTGS
ncbi:MAG: hypothetical protein GY783_03450, partial [Gammaproteobacteria bacterium]|nr:hypothetical protein [Gammaproteobacteria bacterium]